MKQFSLRLRLETRTINVEGVLQGSRVIVKPTKARQQPNQWYFDLLKNLRALGFEVTEESGAFVPVTRNTSVQ